MYTILSEGRNPHVEINSLTTILHEALMIDDDVLDKLDLQTALNLMMEIAQDFSYTVTPGTFKINKEIEEVILEQFYLYTEAPM